MQLRDLAKLVFVERNPTRPNFSGDGRRNYSAGLHLRDISDEMHFWTRRLSPRTFLHFFSTRIFRHLFHPFEIIEDNWNFFCRPFFLFSFFLINLPSQQRYSLLQRNVVCRVIPFSFVFRSIFVEGSKNFLILEKRNIFQQKKKNCVFTDSRSKT